MVTTNVGYLQKGTRVRVKKTQLKGREPSTWQNEAVLIRFEHDALLTDMNKLGITIFRCIVQFDGTPSREDIQTYGGSRCRQASLLPSMVETI